GRAALLGLGPGRRQQPERFPRAQAAALPGAAPLMFGVADYWAFVVAVIVFLAIPGVGNLAIITSTSKGRIVGGLAATLGVIVGDQVLMWLAVAGVAAVLTPNPALFGLVQYAGAISLAWLGVRMILAKPGDAPVLDMQPRRFFRQA